MTKVLVIATHKGGEGKTTNSIFLAEYASMVLKKRTLLIDLDPQANASSRFLEMKIDPMTKTGTEPPLHPDYEAIKSEMSVEAAEIWSGSSDIGDIFYGREVHPYTTYIPLLDIIPANPTKLNNVVQVTQKEIINKIHLQLKKFIEEDEYIQETYDLVIIDTPPSQGPLPTAALRAATHLIIPSSMEAFSMSGIYGALQLLRQENLLRTKSDAVELIGILATKFKNITLHKHFWHDLESNPKTGKHLLPYPMKDRVAYAECTLTYPDIRCVFNLSENNKERMAYESISSNIMKRIFING